MSDLTPEQIAALKAQGFHFRATAEGEVQFTPQEEADWQAEQDALANAPPPVPEQVSMHKVWKAAELTPWEGFDNLKVAIEDAFTQLPAPSDKLARYEWDRAPNLVRAGATTAAVMALLGMTDEQCDELVIFADSLP